MSMSIADAARKLGMKPREVLEVLDTDEGPVVVTHDGSRTLIKGDGTLVTLARHEPVVVRSGDDMDPAARLAELAATATDEQLEAVGLRRVVTTVNAEGHPPKVVDDSVDPTLDAVPDGTVADILAWAGDDAARARRALDVESSRDKPRSSLVTELQRLAG